jgi:hypothetical protein
MDSKFYLPETQREIDEMKQRVGGVFADLKAKFLEGKEVTQSNFLDAEVFQEMKFQDGIVVHRLPSQRTFLMKAWYKSGTIVNAHFHRFSEFITLEYGLMRDLKSGQIIEASNIPHEIKPLTIHEIEILEESCAYIELDFNPKSGIIY